MADLKYSAAFWQAALGANVPTQLEDRLHLVVSLIIFLTLPIGRLLIFIFSSDIKSVKTRAGIFLGHNKTSQKPDEVFLPATVYQLWHTRWPKSRKLLHRLLVEPCARELAVQESDHIIRHPGFRIQMKTLTMATIRALMNPTEILKIIQKKAPFTYGYLYAFTMAPNEYRRKKARAEGLEPGQGGARSRAQRSGPESERSDDDPVEDDDGGMGGTAWKEEYPGFSRNPTFAIIVAICMCTFVRNRATNVLALPLGIFFKISGTSERVLGMLSNIGLCVSSTTVERAKERLSEDAIQLAIALITSASLWFIIFDNINIYLRKFQERVTNRHTMIHATNTAVIGIPGDTDKAQDLEAMLNLRGKRASATFADIRPSAEDAAFIQQAFRCLIAEIIVRYTPGSASWASRGEMLEKISRSMPKDRPLPPEKSDVRPFGVLNVNEGSKKGIIKVLEELQKRSTLSEEEWASKELSALFHFALNATHMIMRTHFGNAISDPASLASDKGKLRRTWDAHKPNYAAAKSLIRHGFIGRTLYRVMATEGMKGWSELRDWQPSFDDVVRLSEHIEKKFTRVDEARQAQVSGDDWYAHDIYFMRDTLLFLLFEHAVSTADAGIVLRVLKYWALSFRGAGQHNYARECAEILITWKYELTEDLRCALERAWFVNRSGCPRRWIAADLYLEQCNFWVKRVFIASGSGVTIEYIMAKGSACVEAFREVSHLVAGFFGDPDRGRRSKEIAFEHDMRVLVEGMRNRQAHLIGQHVVLEAKAKKGSATRRSAIVDVLATGADIWQNGKFTEWLKATTFDPALGYPARGEEHESEEPRDTRLDSDSAFNTTAHNVLDADNYVDLYGDEDEDSGCGALGGGGEFHTGMEPF
ncbi:hypothetical protein C8T65DRAFT_745440 [Cerioporus squamosus]|nr:hypothetical protein C8T65DRAFT_745440 [Cerioporus squamosus]